VNCAQARELIGAHLDGELDVMSSLDFERHVECCTACARARERVAGVRSAAAAAPYFRAPEELAGRIRAVMRREVAPAPSRWRLARVMQPLAVAAAIVLAATLAWRLARTSSGASGLERELVAAHVRSLQADHLLDVASSNQHTVKPWFSGKVDFAPDVRDLAEAGFPLAGGRLDYLDGHAAVALVYRHNLHVINCFVWPAVAASEAELATSMQGYSVLRFTERVLTYWVVSDAAPGTLEEFARALRARGAAATTMPSKSS
jgi:anti-sigma factor RsiW